jgi:hypothetical protein
MDYRPPKNFPEIKSYIFVRFINNPHRNVLYSFFPPCARGGAIFALAKIAPEIAGEIA